MSPKLGETKGSFLVWLFFTLYFALLALLPRGSSAGTLPQNPSLPIIASLLINVVLSYGVLFAFLVVFVALWDKRRTLQKIFASLGFKREGVSKSLLWSIALLPFALFIGWAGMMLGFFGLVANPASDGVSTPTWFLWYQLLYAFFPVAVVEEAFARGYMLDRLMPEHPSRLTKAVPAIILSSLLFTLWHVPGYLGAYSMSTSKAIVLLAGNVFLISIVLSTAYVQARARNILGPVLVHFLLDGLPIILALASG